MKLDQSGCGAWVEGGSARLWVGKAPLLTALMGQAAQGRAGLGQRGVLANKF